MSSSLNHLDKFQISQDTLINDDPAIFNHLNQHYRMQDYGHQAGDDWNMCFYLCATSGNKDHAMELKKILAKNAYQLVDEGENFERKGKMADIEVIFPLVEMYQCMVKIYNLDARTLTTIKLKTQTSTMGLIMLISKSHFYRLYPN